MMRTNYIVAAILILGLSACSDTKEDKKVTETRVDDLENLEGTISDDIIITDTSTDEGPLEAAPPVEVKENAKSGEKPEENADVPAPEVAVEKAATE
ncbi:hypothetical protein [Sphingorhabdus sp.]|uniref:hypothetical protein n=1 Tax=Sphingorhabdus sp. TaxID=1902408 RepID=UPI0035930B18